MKTLRTASGRTKTPRNGMWKAWFGMLLLCLVVVRISWAESFIPSSEAPLQHAPEVLSSDTFSGDFGACLKDLRKFYAGPANPRESNYYFELWEGRTIGETTHWAGLTNNHTLFINSHSKALAGSRHAFYPHDSLVPDAAPMPYYSARDFATFLGEDRFDIHNIVLAGCDFDRSLRTAELRKHFLNATNITHVPTGEAGYQPMYLQAILSRSADIQPLYETARINAQGVKEYHIQTKPSSRSTKLTPYVAELFRPGELEPYKVQLAGRELIAPPQAVRGPTENQFAGFKQDVSPFGRDRN